MDSRQIIRALRRIAENGGLQKDSAEAIELLITELGQVDEEAETIASSGPVEQTRPNMPALNSIFRRIQTPDRNKNPDSFGQTRTPAEGPQIGRFSNLGLIGRGGMGEVYRVREPDLNRRMVIKLLRADRVDDLDAVSRFIEEAQVTSQLAHPGIVPVHELGVVEDNRAYFTMREVRGRTLTTVIKEYHQTFAALDEDQRSWETTFRGLIDIFHRACEPIAYAHDRGIIHRDLKPSNIMVGDFGEVQVLDWGLAKVMGRPEVPGLQDATLPHLSGGLGEENSEILTHRDKDSKLDTHEGSIVGTPAFMPPEQARGALETMGPTADVYSLGAILFMVLDGRMPFEGRSAPAVIFQVLDGIDRRPGTGLGAPVDLIEICLQAMSTDPAKRPPNASEFARAIAQWRDGSNRREKAFFFIEEADILLPHIENLRERAQTLKDQSRDILTAVDASAPVSEKRVAWSLEDEAEFLTREAGARRARAIHFLESALAHIPDLKEAHERLAALYLQDHKEAEQARNTSRATVLEVFIRAHNTGRFDEYLEGQGFLNLFTNPAGARIEIYRYVQKDRRLLPGLQRFLGLAPLIDAELAMGSYLLEIRASGRDPVLYPVYIGRQKTWTGTPPNKEQPLALDLPEQGELADDDIYIPGGRFWRGGDERATNGFSRSEPWVDPFIIKKYSVTHGEYLIFLNELVDDGRIDEAEKYCPRSSGNLGPGADASLYSRDEFGHFHPDRESKDYSEIPIHLIDWHSARAYAAWYARRTSKPWRLPTENEWEKAARGVDGRFYPWGDFLDPTWCRILQSSRQIPHPVSILEYPDDVSPYGMHGAAGNIRDWCLPNDPAEMDDPNFLAAFRGGCWFSTPEMCRLASREQKSPDSRSAGTGFRLARDFPPSRSHR